jgi:hypothetical protein
MGNLITTIGVQRRCVAYDQVYYKCTSKIGFTKAMWQPGHPNLSGSRRGSCYARASWLAIYQDRCLIKAQTRARCVECVRFASILWPWRTNQIYRQPKRIWCAGWCWQSMLGVKLVYRATGNKHHWAGRKSFSETPAWWQTWIPSFCVRRLQGVIVLFGSYGDCQRRQISVKAHNSRAGKRECWIREKDGGLCMQIWMSDG